MTTKQPSASGLDTQQLMLMRLLLGKQTPETQKIEPVHNVGEGISVAGNNIMQAILARREQASQQAELQQMLAAEQAASQQEQTQAAQQQLTRLQTDFPGKSPDWYQSHVGVDASTYNNLLDSQSKQDALNKSASTLQQLPLFQQPMTTGQNLVSAPGSQGLGDPYQRDAQGQAMYGSSLPLPVAMAIAQSPDAFAKLASGYASPYGVTATNGITGPIDTSNPAGYNYAHQVYGFAPQTPAEALTQANTAKMGALDYGIKLKQAPDLVVQPGLQNQGTVANTTGQNLTNAHQSMVNGATPGLLTNQLNQGTIGNDQAQFNLDRNQTALTLLNNGVASGDLFDPAKTLGLQSLIQGNGGPNLGGTLGQIGPMYGNPKDHILTLDRLNKYNSSLPVPYAHLLSVPQGYLGQ